MSRKRNERRHEGKRKCESQNNSTNHVRIGDSVKLALARQSIEVAHVRQLGVVRALHVGKRVFGHDLGHGVQQLAVLALDFQVPVCARCENPDTSPRQTEVSIQ